MKLRCPGCQAVFNAPDNAAGRVGKCPKCETRIAIPAALPVAEAAPPTLPARTTINEMAPRPSLIQKFLNEDQDAGVVETALERVEQILTTGESVLYVAVQAKPVLTIAPDCVVLTSKRFIVYRAKLLGRFDFDDYIWRD